VSRYAVFLLATLALPVQAERLREIVPIVGTDPQAEAVPVVPVPVERVVDFVRELAAAWPGGDLAAFLADDFPGRERLVDELRHWPPLDARFTILSVGTVQTLSQRALPDGRESEVLVRLQGLVEYSDAQGRLQRLPTRQEWILRIAQRVP